MSYHIHMFIKGGVDDGGVTGQRVAKPVTTDQVFNICVKVLDVFKATLNLQLYLRQQNHFGWEVGPPPTNCGHQIRYFKLKHDVFPTLTKCFLGLDLLRV